MLRQALDPTGIIGVVCGSADSPPFAAHSFDFIFVVNALHHFDRAETRGEEAVFETELMLKMVVGYVRE
jgi:SAM-dependent methyltransferase